MIGKEKELQVVLDTASDGKRIFGTSFAIKKGGEIWFGSSGNITSDQPYFIASTTKLFTTAIILRLKSEGKLDLDDPINCFLDKSILEGLHLYKNRDYSNEITIKHLLAHTSGLPDYFQDKKIGGKSLEEEIINDGIDQYWTFEQAIDRAKTIGSLFPPGIKNRAHYSDTNFQLLGKIIEIITGKSFSENCAELITKSLGLSKTYLYEEITDKTPKTLYYKSNELWIPKAFASAKSDGGMVSTATDMLVFIEAFFTGKLFPFAYFNGLKVWNKIFPPFQSGVGIHKFELPWIFNPTGSIPYFIGHSGISGALAFYCPKENLFVAGTINQLAYRDLSFRIMIKLTMAID